MPQRFLPRPVRHWLRKRFGPISPPTGSPPTGTPPAGGFGTSKKPGSTPSGGTVGATGGGSSRNPRLSLPWPISAALLLFGAALSGAALIQAQQAFAPRAQFTAPGPVGSLHILFLTGGQIFIGTLESTDRGTVTLSDVFYIQSAGNQLPVLPSTAQPAPTRGSQLVRRMDNDWHQPDRLAVPIERVLLMETVGRDSLVAKLVAESRGGQARAPIPPVAPPAR